MSESIENPVAKIVQDQIEYYRARAGEYDEWFLRLGRYDYGPEHKRQWDAEVEEVALALHEFAPQGRVLELACGTGWWTEHLARYADSLTAVDASPEVLAINRARLGEGRVRYVQADLFTWHPDTQYDVVFFSFWLSHVPAERFVSFWELVRSCLAPSGRFFLMDSARNPTSSARDQALPSQDSSISRRRLNDGREFDIVKVFYQPEDLQSRLAELGWEAEVRATAHHFIYAHGARRYG